MTSAVRLALAVVVALVIADLALGASHGVPGGTWAAYALVGAIAIAWAAKSLGGALLRAEPEETDD